jgi:hypothetical protein
MTGDLHHAVSIRRNTPVWTRVARRLIAPVLGLVLLPAPPLAAEQAHACRDDPCLDAIYRPVGSGDDG